jgi:hypothetical protein
MITIMHDDDDDGDDDDGDVDEMVAVLIVKVVNCRKILQTVKQ